MPNFPSLILTGKTPSSSYKDLVVHSGSYLVNTLTGDSFFDLSSSAQSDTASYAFTSSYTLTSSVIIQFVLSSSFASSSTSSSYALSASYASNASSIPSRLTVNDLTASIGISGNLFGTANTASYITSSNIVGRVATSSFANTASFITASNVIGTVGNATNAGTATSASYASNALNSTSASYPRNSIQLLSPPGGGAQDAQGTISPQFEGQIGITYTGNKDAFLYFGRSTATGDWNGQFSFPGGMSQIGSKYSMSLTSPSFLDVSFHGNSDQSSAGGDQGVYCLNYSTHSTNSGPSFGLGVHDITGSLIDRGAQWVHVPSNRVRELIPGWSYMVFNPDSSHLNIRGFGVAQPNVSGFGTGNASYMMCDFVTQSFRIPYWNTNSYQPFDAGWKDTVFISPATRTSSFYGAIAFMSSSAGQPKGMIDNTTGNITTDGKIIGTQGNVDIKFIDGGEGGMFEFENTSPTTDIAYIGKGSGLILSIAGQGVHIKEGSNATLGTTSLTGTSSVTVATTKVTNSSRIFLTIQSGSGTVGSPYVFARTASTSFNVRSTTVGDTSLVAWMIVEPS